MHDEHQNMVTLVFRPQGSQRVYPRHVEEASPLSVALERFFAEVLNLPTLPNGLQATLRGESTPLDIARSPLELGLKSGDQITLSWSTSAGGGAGLGRPLGAKRTGVTVRVPQKIVSETLTHLRSAANRGVEGVCYWVALFEDGAWDVIQVIKPDARASSGRVDIPTEENRRITESLPQGAAVIAQVHSHLGSAFHSDRDDRNPYSFEPGFLSIVVPWGANESVRWPLDVKVYELVSYPRWRPLSPREVARRVVTSG